MPANRQGTDKKKRKAPKTAWPKGKSGNPAGRPKNGESWSEIIKAVGEMYPEDLLKIVGRENELGQQIRKYPPKVQMKFQVVIRVFAAMMFEPNNSLFNSLMDRVEGKVPDHLKVDNLPVLVFKNKNDADNKTNS